ncbi:methyl-CpG-binding domain-containing protein 10-like protein [Tanacetum coccineum]
MDNLNEEASLHGSNLRRFDDEIKKFGFSQNADRRQCNNLKANELLEGYYKAISLLLPDSVLTVDKDPTKKKKYLKANPGGPKLSEFDWGSGETPRRSSRISEKVKSTPTSSETEPVKKRVRKSSSSKKGKKENEEEAPEVITDIDVEMKEDEKNEKDGEKQEKNGEIAPEEKNNEMAPEEKNDEKISEAKNGHKANGSTNQEEIPVAEAEKDVSTDNQKGNLGSVPEKKVEAEGEAVVENGSRVEGQ